MGSPAVQLRPVARVAKRPLRIALVSATRDILGGHAVQMEALAEGLAADGCSVRVIPINPRPPAGLAWTRRLPVLRTLANEAQYLPSLRALGEVDVAHVFSAAYWSFLLAPAPAIVAARALGTPVVVHYHSGEADDHLARWGAGVHPWLRRAEAIAVPSEYLRASFLRHGYDAEVIPNVVDVARFAFRDRPVLRPRLLSNRNLEPGYRVDVTIRAFAPVLAAHPGATLTVVGTGSQRPALEGLAAALGVAPAVRFLGRVAPEDMPARFAEADLFVNASVLDNQPVSILEAFAAGVPVVTTPTGDIAAMAGHGRLARLVAPDDPDALATGLLEALAQPAASRERARAAHRALSRYTWPAVGAAWHALYDRLVSRP
jgi:glycosyltransferase involved in cell wall biosynthesis